MRFLSSLFLAFLLVAPVAAQPAASPVLPLTGRPGIARAEPPAIAIALTEVDGHIAVVAAQGDVELPHFVRDSRGGNAWRGAKTGALVGVIASAALIGAGFAADAIGACEDCSGGGLGVIALLTSIPLTAATTAGGAVYGAARPVYDQATDGR